MAGIGDPATCRRDHRAAGRRLEREAAGMDAGIGYLAHSPHHPALDRVAVGTPLGRTASRSSRVGVELRRQGRPFPISPLLGGS